MIKLQIDNGKRSIEVTANGVTFEWTYDVLTVKLEAERLELKHGIRSPGESSVKPANDGFLSEFASVLSGLGLTDCTKDAAFQVHQIVNSQFIAMSSALNAQVNESLKTVA